MKTFKNRKIRNRIQGRVGVSSREMPIVASNELMSESDILRREVEEFEAKYILVCPEYKTDLKTFREFVRKFQIQVAEII